MALHPDIAAFIATLPPSDHSDLDIDAWRDGEEQRVPPVEDRTPQLSKVQDHTAETSNGDVPVRIYTPVAKDVYGLVVYFHGGAFFSGTLDTHDQVARLLAEQSGMKVISVGYRRAPEHAYPAGLQDCYAVVRWAAEQGEFLQWDGRTLAVTGDSSGGNFVAAVTAMDKDNGPQAITHQVLLYPSVDLDFDENRYGSMKENATGYGLETAGLRPHNAPYLESGADPADPLVSPIKRSDMSGLPPALIITAEFDPLRDEGESYGRRLQDAGVKTTIVRWDSANHGFMQNFAWIPEMRQAYETIGTFLNS